MKKQLQKRLLITGTTLLISILANAQWTTISPIPMGAIGNDGAVSFTIGSKGYIVAGSGYNTMYSYDTITTAWSLVGTIPDGMGHAFAMAFAIDGKGYVIGGDTSGYPISAVWEFDPSVASNQWSQKNNFPGGPRDAGFGFAIGNYGYLGAGNDNVYLYNDIWKYNAAGDSWSQLPASLPIPLLFPSSFVIGNKAYIVTGGTSPNGIDEVKSMWCLDGSNDSISSKAAFGGLGRSAAFAFSNNSFGYVGGGQTNFTTNFNDMWMYDEANDHWSLVGNSPLFGSAWSSAFAIGNSAYAGLGAKFVGTALQGNLNFYKYSMNSVTGISVISDQVNQVAIYPNPASREINVGIKNNEDVSYKIVNTFGELIRSGLLKGQNKSIDVSDIADGIYIFNWETDKFSGCGKICIEK